MSDAKCYTLPNGACVSPLCSLHGTADISQTVAGLPRSHWHCGFHNFDASDLSDRDLQTLGWWNYEASERRAPHLVLVGTIGSGKTHLAVALYRWVALQVQQAGWPAHCTFIHVDEFLNKMDRAQWPSERAEILEDYSDGVFCTVLDDLFGSKYNDRQTGYLTQLVDALSRANAALIITSNIQPGDWELSAHELSRLRQNAKTIRFTGKDRRK